MIKSNTKSQEITRRYRRSPKGVLTNMYDHMKRRQPVAFSLPEFHARFLQDRKFLRLYKEWVGSGYQKQLRPSLDRIDKTKGYTVDNTNMMTWAENRFKQNMERRSRKGRVYQILGSKVIASYASQRQAVYKTGLSQSQMSKVLTGKGFTCGGYKWSYENPELLSSEETK